MADFALFRGFAGDFLGRSDLALRRGTLAHSSQRALAAHSVLTYQVSDAVAAVLAFYLAVGNGAALGLNLQRGSKRLRGELGVRLNVRLGDGTIHSRVEPVIRVEAPFLAALGFGFGFVVAQFLGVTLLNCGFFAPEGCVFPRRSSTVAAGSLAGSLFIAPNTFQVLKSRFEPLEDDEERIEIAPFDTR